MTEKESLEVQLALLQKFNHVPAWTGKLGELRQRSYVLYGDIIDEMNVIKKQIKDYEKGKTKESDRDASSLVREEG